MPSPLAVCRVTRTTLQSLILLISLLGSTHSLWAQTWPADIDRRLELNWPARMPTADRIYGKLGTFDQLRQILPEQVVVFDDLGKLAVSKVILTRVGRRELWFQAEPTRKYFVGWATVAKTTAPAKSGAAADRLDPKDAGQRAKPKAATLEPRYALPPGWLTATPVAEVRPGEMFSRPTWENKQGTLFNTGRRTRDFLVSRGVFHDFELAVRIRPEAAGQFGVAVRIGNVSSPVNSGVCWLVGVARSADQTLGANQTLGLVRDDEEGPLLKAKAWNEVKVICEGRVVQLLLNGELCKTLKLLEGESSAGAVALVADNATASFDDLKIREIPTQKVLLEQSFSSEGADPTDNLNEHWRGMSQEPASGFLRVINAGTTATRFEVTARVHQAPWRIGPFAFSQQTVEPGQATPWLWLESLEGISSPCTLEIAASRSAVRSSRPKLKGADQQPEDTPRTVEFVRSLAGQDGQFLRRLRLQSEPLIVEVRRPDLRDETDLRTPEEIGEEVLDQVRKLKFKGKPPEKLPSGSPSGTAADLEAGRLLGFNAVAGGPHNFPVEAFRKFRFRYIFSDSHAIETREQGFGFKRDAVNLEMKKLFDEWTLIGLADKVHFVNLFEDAALNIEGQVRKVQPVNLAIDPNAWLQMMQVAGLKPADFLVADNPPPADAAPDSPEYWQKLQAAHPRDGREDPAGALKSLRLLASIWPTRFRNGTDAARRAFRRGVLTSADIHGEQYFLNGVGGIDPWTVYSRQQALDIAMSRDDSALDPGEVEFLIDLQRSAQGTSQRPVFGSFAAQTGRRGRSSRSLELRGFSALGAGARGLTFSAWGPRWQADSKWYSDDPSRLEAIGRINHAAGWVEEILLDGHPAPGEVGILVSPLSDLWEYLPREKESIDVRAERHRLHRLFRSFHFQVDFLHEDQLPRDSELDRYRVLVLTQPCLKLASAKRLVAWVNRGGTLIGSGSIGQFDEHYQPYPGKNSVKGTENEGMLAAFGINGLEWQRSAERTIAATRAATVEVRVPVRSFVLDSAEVVHLFDTKAPAVTRRKFGKGQLIFCGFALGAVYHDRARLDQEVYKGMQAAVRELVRPWLTGSNAPLCRTDHPLISARLIRSYHGNAVFLINLSGGPVSRVRITLKMPGIQSAESLSQGTLVVERSSLESRFAIPLETTDVVRFK